MIFHVILSLFKWWFQTVLIFTPTSKKDDPIWLMFFRWVAQPPTSYGQVCIDFIRDIFQLLVVILKSLRQPGHRPASRPHGVFSVCFSVQKRLKPTQLVHFCTAKKDMAWAHPLSELSRMNLWPVLFPLNPPLMGSNAFVPGKSWKNSSHFLDDLIWNGRASAIFGWMDGFPVNSICHRPLWTWLGSYCNYIENTTSFSAPVVLFNTIASCRSLTWSDSHCVMWIGVANSVNMLFPSSKQGFKLDQEGIYVKGQSCFSRSMKSLASTEKVPGVSGGFWNVCVFNVCFQCLLSRVSHTVHVWYIYIPTFVWFLWLM